MDSRVVFITEISSKPMAVVVVSMYSSWIKYGASFGNATCVSPEYAKPARRADCVPTARQLVVCINTEGANSSRFLKACTVPA